ncbi:MAG: DUF1223 domain-containing protein [Bacteroidota bacterium]|nr:DUF1223 domain-containing protein [Bacteroidota bacterium]
MKKLRYFLLLPVPLFTLWFCTSSSSVKSKEDNNSPTKTYSPASKNVAVLELFTSQGCSSCPSADRLLEKYSTKDNVIALSFHVDYWNRLGWKDPYSSKEFTERQYNYASALNAGVYTPQLVINGQSEMVGSDARKIDNTLKKVWSQDQASEISIQSAKLENGKAIINYSLMGNAANNILNIALVEKKTMTEIKAGENGGATLSGTNVVRNFQTLSDVKDGKNSYSIEVPAGLSKDNISIVLYLQKGNKEITAACETAAIM